ncbi:MAG: T9SS type A sorting domain-containing protein [Ignavibacteriales bacterium]|nr:MAG: T9SS type A sorting domain-containing protein [Ignavibacteriales bacterium]
MKQLWKLIALLVVISVPSFAQFTPHDSTISGNITVSRVLDKNKVYLLQGFVYVQNGATLTVPAGTLILGEKSSQGSLIIERGGKLIADGTAQEPIVFTSQLPAGLRSRGDWGGIVICGKAANNRPGGNFVVEGNIGSIAGYGDGGIVQDDNDNSGILRYVRIEFPGIPFTPNNEINGLTLGAVGRGTVLEHIMVSYSGDDSYEFFGGTVNAKWLIAYKALDDDFDTDFGYSGKIQFAVVYRDPILADVSNSEAFESDNDGSGTTASPRTSPVFSNFTVIGPKRVSTDVSGTNYNALFFHGIHHRRSSRHSLFNSVVTGFDEGGLFLDGATVQGDTANFAYRNNTFSGMATLITPTTYNAWFTSYGNTLLTEPNSVLLKAPFNQTSPVLVPQAGSPLLGSAAFTGSLISDPFFTAVTYRGAFSGNGADRWDIGWSNYDPNGTNYIRSANITSHGLLYITTGNGESRAVVFGRAVGATDGLDASLGEALLPPPPAAGIVDLRWELPGGTQFSSIDMRSSAINGTITYTLDFQAGSPSTALTLNWDPNYIGAGTITLKDGFGGAIFADVNMKTVSSQVVTGLTSVIVEVVTNYNQTIVVGNEWNLISFPGIHPNSMSVDTLYRGKNPAANVFKFDAGYVAVTSLTPGEGYWMNHSGIRTYNWNGTVQSGILYPRLNSVGSMAYPGKLGWNMVGGYNWNADVSFIRTMPENKIFGLVFQYVPGSGYVASGSMTPGNGYWINLTSAANIYVPGPYAPTLGKNPIDQLISKDWGKVVITDAAGQSYVLYAAGKSVDLNSFNLPPLPPAGLFDVRFGSQRFVEDLSSAGQTINLSGVVYPVTISVDGVNIQLEDAVNGTFVKADVKDGSSYVLDNSSINVLKISSDKVVPVEYALEQNYPNPFNPSTTIKFSVPEISNVKLTVYNALGQKVAELVNNTLEAGSYSYSWDASNVASGLYFYELNTNNFSSVKKMMLVK